MRSHFRDWPPSFSPLCASPGAKEQSFEWRDHGLRSPYTAQSRSPVRDDLCHCHHYDWLAFPQLIFELSVWGDFTWWTSESECEGMGGLGITSLPSGRLEPPYSPHCPSTHVFLKIHTLWVDLIGQKCLPFLFFLFSSFLFLSFFVLFFHLLMWLHSSLSINPIPILHLNISTNLA